jgi:hypothetical protein
MRLGISALFLALVAGCSAPEPADVEYLSPGNRALVPNKGRVDAGGGTGRNDTQGGSTTAGSSSGGGTTSAGSDGTTTGGGETTTGGMGANTGGMGANTGGMGANTGGMGANTGGMGANTGGMGANTGGMGANTGGMSGTTGGAKNAFTDAPAYVKGKALRESANPRHAGGASNAKQNCLGCHTRGGNNPKVWLFAGTIYETAAGTTPAVGAEVRLVTAAGTELGKAYSDNDGNFFFEGNAQFPATGVLAGARNGPTPGLMPTSPAVGACNSCHAPNGTAKPLHVK